MKKIQCELCGGNNLVKEGDYFVCQHCGTKYSPDQAKKLIIEGTVDVSGSTIKVDNSSKLENLYKLARKARLEQNAENAEKYYGKILLENPDDWEAYFYKTYFKCMQCKIIEIGNAGYELLACLGNTFRMVVKNVPEVDQIKVFSKITDDIIRITSGLVSAAYDSYLQYAARDSKSKYLEQMMERISPSTMCLTTYKVFLEELKIKDHRVKKMLNKLDKAEIEIFHKDNLYRKYDYDSIMKMVNKNTNRIKETEPEYNPPEFTQIKSGGCYVATCVYGSYDCPEVWTLRRYRDFTLAETWYGRAFIRIYYVISPTIVKWFGETTWFKNIWKPKLDRMVNHLNTEGVENTPYQDIEW